MPRLFVAMLSLLSLCVSITAARADQPQTERVTQKDIDAAKDLPHKAFLYFVSQGWTQAQAAGIVGNLQAECGAGFTCSLSSGGLAQWRAERVTRFRQVFGYPLTKASFNDQLAYIQWELTHPKSPWNPSGKILKGAKDAANAAALFDIHYERSAGISRQKRMVYAQAILKKHALQAALPAQIQTSQR